MVSWPAMSTLADHIVATSEVVHRVRELTGRDVHPGGYSQGGVFSYSVAAYRRGAGLASVISFGSRVDTKSVGIFSLPEPVMEFAADTVAALLDRTGLPGWATREGFRLLDPVKNVRSRVQFLRQLHDREALLPDDLSVALGQLPPDRRPHVVHVVDKIPPARRIDRRPTRFAEDGRPAPGPGVCELGPVSGEYRTTRLAKPVRTDGVCGRGNRR